MTRFHSITWVSSGGPLAWWGSIDIDEQSYEGVRAGHVTVQSSPIVAVAVASTPGEEDEIVGLTWDTDHCNGLVNPETEFNDQCINTWFLGVWPQGQRPDDEDVERVDSHLRNMAWGRIRRQVAA